jgi:hypothetical protein
MDKTVLATMLMILFLVLVFGGIAARRQLKGVDLKSVSGALLATVILAKYLVYTAFVFPVVIVLGYTLGKPGSTKISVPFKIGFEPSNYQFQIRGLDANRFSSAELSDLTGTLTVANPDWITITVLTLGITVGVVILSKLLKNAEQVLRSLYEKLPFQQENSKLLRGMAWYGIGLWFCYIGINLLLAIYVKNNLVVQNIALTTIDIKIIQPLFLCGLLFVLAEVFRIGFEVKQENELTV